ncbi:peptidylprolyl isomerase [Rhodobacterales bacterium HKCCE2091]|nr:peptidylprolyl isomerase [Rhodobacterales bacterium HKCCE2091]
MARKKTASNILALLLLGVLLVGLAGFGITSFSGGSATIGRVGTSEITAQAYARALNQEMNAISAETGQPIRLADLIAADRDARVRQALIAEAALSSEADAMGLSVGDEEVARQIRAVSAFRGSGGDFDREVYRYQIENAGYDAAEFEAEIRDTTARSLLQQAVVGGVEAPGVVVDAITARETQTRDFTIATLDAEALEADLPEPTEDDLRGYYDDNGEIFERPELRRISYAWITPDMIMDEVQIDEDALRQLYEDRAGDYIQPERRIVERLVFPSEEEAQAARERIDAGEAGFEDLVEARGLSLDDVDLGDVADDDLSDDAAAAVFAEDADEIVGPVESAFGPALFRINAVLSATEVTFEEAEDDLRAELSAEAARRAISAMRESLEDALAGGAEIEDLAAESEMELGTIDYGPDTENGIAGYDDFRAAADAAGEGDFPEILDLSDGGLFALRLDEIVPPAVPPFEEIEDEVEDAWRRDAIRVALDAEANAILADMATLGATFEDRGLPTRRETGISRLEFIPDLPPVLVGRVFELTAPGDAVVVPAPGAALIARLDAVHPGNLNDERVAALRDLVGQTLDQSYAQDLFEGFGQAMEEDVGIELDQAMINAVHANFP